MKLLITTFFLAAIFISASSISYADEGELSLLDTVIGTYSGMRRNFDEGRSFFDPVNPPMISARMSISMVSGIPRIELAASENCIQSIGPFKNIETFSYGFTPNRLEVRAIFEMTSQDCPKFAQLPFALLVFYIDKTTGEASRPNLSTYTSRHVKGGRYDLFK